MCSPHAPRPRSHSQTIRIATNSMMQKKKKKPQPSNITHVAREKTISRSLMEHKALVDMATVREIMTKG